ncbi:MAG: DNA mismatch repair endonuclease MutL [Planctomycetota bacterium]|jgi:DNA mismatch repair protein MutL
MGIRVLPTSLANKIAAGEVIERPASVVKELVENSIDAGARRVEVHLEDGGASLIRVVDDGCGMDADDVALAFVGHATSKLPGEEDLFNVRTMGFRGEALASIGAVADARIASRTHDSDVGHEVEMNAGVLGEVRECGAPVGCQVEARNLFHNVPVRKKFLKTTATEMAHISEAVTRLALARPETHFILVHNGRSVFNLPPAEDAGQRIGEFFGHEIADNMVRFGWESPEVRLEGYLLPPTVDRRNTKMQYTYVNGRYVRNSTLMHAIAEAYSGLVTAGRRPVCFLFLMVDPSDVDVNVHPTKLEVKFRKTRELHQQVLTAMRDCLRGAKLTPQVALTAEGVDSAAGAKESVRQAIADFFAGPRDDARGYPHPAGRHPGGPAVAAAPTPTSQAGPSAPAAPAPEFAPMRARFGNCLQVLDTYIVEEIDEGINLIDQHALHERILYNQLKERLPQGRLDSQQLLVPELVELPQQEFYAVMGLQEDLARFGMDIEAFGERTVIVRSFPQILGRFDGKRFFEDLLDELEGPEGARKVDGRLEKLIRMMACRGAVKAGQRLSADQMRRLLEQRQEAGPTDTCPHGRPTTILLSRRELDKQFRRS